MAPRCGCDERDQQDDDKRSKCGFHSFTDAAQSGVRVGLGRCSRSSSARACEWSKGEGLDPVNYRVLQSCVKLTINGRADCERLVNGEMSATRRCGWGNVRFFSRHRVASVAELVARSHPLWSCHGYAGRVNLREAEQRCGRVGAGAVRGIHGEWAPGGCAAPGSPALPAAAGSGDRSYDPGVGGLVPRAGCLPSRR